MKRGDLSLSQVIERVATSANGRTMGEVLKVLQKEIDSNKVRVSSDLRRATLEALDGGLTSVRVTSARQSHPHGTWHFRFKSPTDAKRFRVLYFGGLNQNGVTVIHKLTAVEIGHKKTITLPAS